MDNIQALMALASRIDEPFRLPLPYAPGASFVGVMVRPGAFGLGGHPDAGAAGRGVTPEQAFLSCMGEAAEYLSFIEREDDPLLARCDGAHGLSENELTWALAGIGLEYDHRLDTLDWIEAAPLGGGEKVCFPSELVLRRPAGLRSGMRQAESTGMGAGADLHQAIMSGLMEVVERDAFALWWFGAAEATRLAPACLTGDCFEEFANQMRQGSDRPHWLLDITSDLNIPVIVAVSTMPNGEAAVVGMSANVDPARAAKSAFLEMCQMELAQELSLSKFEALGEEAIGERDRAWIERFHKLSIQAFPSLCGVEDSPPTWPHESSDALGDCLSRIDARGFRAYAIDLSRSEISVPVAKVLIPGLQTAKVDWITPRLRKKSVILNSTPDYFHTLISPI